MNKSSVNSPLNNVDVGTEWSSQAIEWLSSNRKMIIWIFLAFLAFLIFAYRVAAARTLSAESDFFHAQTAFAQFQQANTYSQDSSASSNLEELKAIMKRRPEIKPRYEGPLTQTLLIMNQPSQAQLFATDIFDRTQSDHLQLYQEYSQTSLLIGEEHYDDALQKTQKLQGILDQADENANQLLYVFNLIRLAMLYQQMNQPENELIAWEKLQNQPQRLESVLATSQVLKVGQASLNEYIEERKKTLTP
jgi:hypothetical protein